MNGYSKQEEMGLVLRETAEGLVVTNQYQYDEAAGFLTTIKTKQKEVEAAMDPQCKAAYAAWQTANNQKKQYLKPYEEAEEIVKKSLGAYQLQQRRLAEIAAKEAQEAAEKEEAKIRKKLIKQGREDEADMVFVPVVAPDHSVTKANGVSTTNDIDIEITDTKELLQWLLTSTLDLSTIVQVKTAPIKQWAKLTKTFKIPGCRVVESVKVAAKARG